MKYFFDTEFIDDGKTIDLISLAIVAEDGRELHVQSCEFNHRNASQWVKDNVLTHLLVCPSSHAALLGLSGLYRTDRAEHQRSGQCVDQQRGLVHNCPWRTRNQIAREVRAFCDPEQHGPIELWGWCAGYDFVALCQLFGTMMELPAGFPHYIRDIQHLLDARGMTDDMLPPQAEQAHNALADARYIKQLHDSLIYWPGKVFWSAPTEADRERFLNGTWLSDVKSLILANNPGRQATGERIHYVTTGDPRPDENPDALAQRVSGYRQREGNTSVHVHLDSEQITPETWKLIGGYVGHEGVATTGGDNGQADELLSSATGDPERSVQILQEAASDLKNITGSIFGAKGNSFDANAYIALLQQQAASKQDEQAEQETKQ